jgi:hypothetical protein
MVRPHKSEKAGSKMIFLANGKKNHQKASWDVPLWSPNQSNKIEKIRLGAHFSAVKVSFFSFVICALRTFLAPKQKNRRGTYFNTSKLTGVFATYQYGSYTPNRLLCQKVT